MTQLQGYFNHHSFGFWLTMGIALVLIAVWLLMIALEQRRLSVRLEAILSDVEGGNVPAMLAEYLATVRTVASQTRHMEQRVDYLYRSLPSLVRHVGLVRFSPFHDTGGDQSFSMAILDGRGDGVVVSGLHSRQESKLFAKPVTARASRYPLTEEEKQAIEESVTVEGTEGGE